MKQPKLFSTSQWITMVGSIFVAGMCFTAYAFTTFEQKSDLREVLNDIRTRLTNIEQTLRQGK